ncbi:MAG: hypothetical protein H6632_23695 [Anaerolineales bacterium]|nr:hypothetical protein [Anaerolineales bacterium]
MQTPAGADTDAGDILMGGIFDRLQDDLDARNNKKGLSPVDLLDMPQDLADLINQIIRRNGMKLEDVAQNLNQSIEKAEQTLDKLVEKGYIRRVKVKQEVWYKAQFGRKADKVVSDNIWSKLDNIFKDEQV